MNIEQIKSEWSGYNARLEATEKLNDVIITSMLKERSRSRVTAIRRSNRAYLVWMLLVLAMLFAVITGNPFDFTYSWQFIPYWILVAGVLLTTASLIQSLKNLGAEINKVDLSSFLINTIRAYEMKRKIESWFVVLIFSGGLLTVISFLPKKLQHKSLAQSLLETTIGVAVTLCIYLVAFKAGAFKRRKQAAFENDLAELNELKALSVDLKY